MPYEFYKIFWNILKDDLHEILTYAIENLTITESQSLGVITLQPKNGDKTLLSNWRPITLMTCDYKILTKVFAARLKHIIPKIICQEQFCCPGKSIIDSNLIMRDVLYFCNENNIQGAVLTLDWSKAYDRVDHNFLFAVLAKLGFCDSFIKILKLFCSNVRSVIQINGNITSSFHIGRGVRQGCPLSMMIYVLFKEALYSRIKALDSIKGPELPNNNSLKILGYADDTNLLLRDNESIIEAMKVIKMFETAAGAILNENKTKIFGVGSWNNKVDWPIPWIQSSITSFKSLGILYSNDFNTAVYINWEAVLSAIETKIQTMQTIRSTIYQRAILLNCLIFAKLWYVSHIFLLPVSYANKIKRVAFNYIWGRKYYEPIKRSTLYSPKNEGGLV